MINYRSESDVVIKCSKLFINGEWVDSESGKKMDVINPCTGKKIGEVSEAGEADVNKAVIAARAAYPKWRDLDPAAKGKLLNDLADRIEKDGLYIAALEAVDSGKSVQSAYNFDLKWLLETIRYYAGICDKIYGKSLPMSGDHICIVQREPFGVCGQIIAWNFPMGLFGWKVAPALAAGNTVVIKSSEYTPLSALYIAHLCSEVGFPGGVINVLSGFGPSCGEYLARHFDVNKLSFTGSSATGKYVMKCAAESNMKCVSLECGGKSPLIVFPDVKDVKVVTKQAIEMMLFEQGQVCTAPSRMFIHEDIYEQFLEEAVKICKEQVFGDQFTEGATQRAVISKMQYDKILKYIEIGKEEGAKMLCGGKPVDGGGGGGYFIEPTIFADCNDNMKIVRDEIFGPVVCILKFKDVEEVIRRANDTPYGLGAGVYTEDMSIAMKLARKIEAGNFWINCWDEVGTNVPFGGYKESGFGKDSGEEALDSYTRKKSIVMACPGLKEKY